MRQADPGVRTRVSRWELGCLGCPSRPEQPPTPLLPVSPFLLLKIGTSGSEFPESARLDTFPAQSLFPLILWSLFQPCRSFQEELPST